MLLAWFSKRNTAVTPMTPIVQNERQWLRSNHGVIQANGPRHENLASAMFARFYGKLLISRLGRSSVG